MALVYSGGGRERVVVGGQVTGDTGQLVDQPDRLFGLQQYSPGAAQQSEEES